MGNFCLAYIACNKSSDCNFFKQIKQIDFKKLTHMAIAFSTIKKENGTWIPFVSSEIINGIKKYRLKYLFNMQIRNLFYQ